MFQDAEVDPGATGGAGLDLEPRVPGPQLVEQPIGSQRLGMDGGPARVFSLVQVAVVVPLEVVQPILGDQCAQLPEHPVIDLGAHQVDHLLAPPPKGRAARPGQHPVSVLAQQVRLGVGHLRLHPQPDLHTQLADPVHQRVQAVWPDERVDSPVTQPRRVVTATEKPAVVQHKPFNSDGRRGLGQAQQPGQVVVEVDGLPRVQHQRSRRRRVVRAGALQLVQPSCGAVEPLVRPHQHRPGRRVCLARRQLDLAGAQQLAAANRCPPLLQLLDQVHVVATPGNVRGPHLAVAEAETVGTSHYEQRSVVAGAAAARLAEATAVQQRAALRRALTAPSAGQVEHLGRPLRHGQQRQHSPDLPTVGAGGQHRRPSPDDATGLERELAVDLHPHL